MKLFVRGILLNAAFILGALLAGCGTTGNSFSAASAGVPAENAPPAASVARFRVGETVTVAFSGLPAGDPLQSSVHEEPIKEDGTLTLPYIGSVSAAGKTAGELQNEIYANYVPKYYRNLTVTVKSGDRVYYVGGEVKAPNRELYMDGTTVTKAIQSAGGLTDFANHNKVWVTHAATGQRIRVNYDKALQHAADDPPVYPDDQVYVDRRIF